MGHSGRERHRDREPGHRQAGDAEPAAPDRAFRLTVVERQKIAQSLRFIDEARRALEQQQNPDNREIIRELRASADRIFDVIDSLEETD